MISYIQTMLSTGGVVSYIGIGIVALFFLFIIWQGLRGFGRGFLRQALHLGIMAVAALISFSIAKGIWNGFFSAIDEQTVEEMLSYLQSQEFYAGLSDQIRSIIDSLDLRSAQYVLALPLGTIAVPVLFSAIFIVLNWLLRIVYAILSRIIIGKRSSSLLFRLLGLALGVIEGLAMATIILLPFTAAASVADTVFTAIVDTEDEETTELEEVYTTYITPITNNPVLPFMGSMGADSLLNNFATLKIGREKVNLRDELDTIATAIVDDGMNLKDINWKDLTEEDKTHLTNLVSTATDSTYLASIISGTLGSMSAMLDGGISALGLEEPYSTLLDSAISIFADSSIVTLSPDLNTIRNVYFILSDDGVLLAIDGEGSITDALTRRDDEGNTTVAKVINELELNERTKPLIKSLTQISLSALSGAMGGDTDASEIYTEVKSQVTSILEINKNDYTKDEYIAEVSGQLNTALTNNNINLEPEIVDQMSEYVYDNLSDKTELSDDDFNDLMLNYYDAYLDYMESKDAEAAP